MGSRLACSMCTDLIPVSMQSLNSKIAAKPTVRAQARSAVRASVAKRGVMEGAAAAAVLAAAAPVHAAEVLMTTSMDGGSMIYAVGGLGAVAGLGALLVATDPQKRYAAANMTDAFARAFFPEECMALDLDKGPGGVWTKRMRECKPMQNCKSGSRGRAKGAAMEFDFRNFSEHGHSREQKLAVFSSDGPSD